MRVCFAEDQESPSAQGIGEADVYQGMCSCPSAETNAYNPKVTRITTDTAHCPSWKLSFSFEQSFLFKVALFVLIEKVYVKVHVISTHSCNVIISICLNTGARVVLTSRNSTRCSTQATLWIFTSPPATLHAHGCIASLSRDKLRSKYVSWFTI